MGPQCPQTSTCRRNPNGACHLLAVQPKHLSNNKKITYKYLCHYRHCLIIEHFFDPVHARLTEFYCNLSLLHTIGWVDYKIHLKSKTKCPGSKQTGRSDSVYYLLIWIITKSTTRLIYQIICIIHKDLEFLLVTANALWLRRAPVPTQLKVTEFILVPHYMVSHPTR
jgi:hypothetical protein